MTTPSSDIFKYCDNVRERFKRFSLGREKWAEDIAAYIKELKTKDQWSPPALLQINPKYEEKSTIAELVQEGELHENWKTLDFKKPLHLHQCQAIDAAKRDKNYIVTAGTGSGKSMGYIIPIVNKIFTDRQERPGAKGIKAIICYPMNALVNSQREELKKLDDSGLATHGIISRAYTGDEDEPSRKETRENPPDILLTNFMMLEYLLTRNKEEEKGLLYALRDCEFLVMDELHTYRGRQGADVAMLIRRLRLFLNRKFLCIGTSATMTSDEQNAESRRLVADFATRLFGDTVQPQNVIEETLVRQTNCEKTHESVKPDLSGEISAGAESVLKSEDVFYNSASAVWCELEFGIESPEAGGRAVRKRPQSIKDAAEKMAKDSGMPSEKCEQYLRDFLAGAAHKELFAMRLHQFFSGPGQFLGTLKDKNGKRDFSVLGEKRNAADAPFYATHFCHTCSNEFHPVWMREDFFENRNIEDIGDEGLGENINFGFITPVRDNMRWSGEEEERDQKLPDIWLRETASGIKVRREKRHLKPQKISLNQEGKQKEGGAQYVFLPGKFCFCPHCGDTHSGAGRDINRLASLNAEGRCSATTALLLSVLEFEPPFRENERAKTLAFSDNRQDAALQAGYFNDFVFTLKIRSSLLRALENAGGELRYDKIAGDVMTALGFTEEEMLNNPTRRSEFLSNIYNDNLDNLRRMRDLLRDIIGYHLVFDLRRGWRHNNPNLQKLKMMEIHFDGVEQLDNIAKWQNPTPFITDMSPDKRQELAKTVLDHMLEERCVNSQYLSDDMKESIPNRAHDNITPEWFDSNDREKFQTAKMLAVGAIRQKKWDNSCAPSGPVSRLGKKIRPKSLWHPKEPGAGMLPTSDYNDTLHSIVKTLSAANLIVEKKLSAESSAWQLNCDCLIWKLSESPDGQNYHAELYRNIKGMLSNKAERNRLAHLTAREHTAQVNAEDRKEYEKLFRQKDGALPVLVCSPTMELGIDISDLNTVYLRNVPPTPANYVQRSGRAGRAGKPALVITYCAAQSPHDQYFFRRKSDMVAGIIRAPTIELANRDLLESHFRAIWLQKTGVAFPPPTADIMDFHNMEKLPIKDEFKLRLQDTSAQEDAEQDIRTLITDILDAGLVPEHAKHWLTPKFTPPPMYRSLEDALDRWRSLYWALHAQMKKMGKIMQDPTVSKKERDDARRLHYAAYGQETTLREEGKQDFYSYRFLASQGFLPGYNFPRLPLVAYLPRGKRFDRLSRPRFLALSEFGPHSFIYHQGSRYVVSRATLPASEKESVGTDGLQTRSMRICGNCGHGYFVPPTTPDCCTCCKKPLTDAEPVDKLYEIQNFTARRRDRINAGEEDRQRQGYLIKNAYCFPDLPADKIPGKVKVGDNTLFLEYGQAATVWRINLGWKRQRRNGNGFYINPATGEWKGQDKPDNNDDYHQRIVPYVKDNRNILVMRWEKKLNQTATTTLRHALKIGMTERFQLEESELSVEPLPDASECKAFLYYESAEGGAGVLTHLPGEKKLLGKIAKTALRRMHYDVKNFDGVKVEDLKKYEEKDACNGGCYRCLFSYYNQTEQNQIDRGNVDALSILLGLANAEVTLTSPPPPAAGGEPPAPTIADDWTRTAKAAGWKKPDKHNYELPGSVFADHYYTELQAAVFVGKPPTAVQKSTLDDAGIIVISFPAEPEKWEAIFQHPANKKMFS